MKLSTYYLRKNQTESGPFTFSQIEKMWSAGIVTADTLILQSGQSDWRPLVEAMEPGVRIPIPHKTEPHRNIETPRVQNETVFQELADGFFNKPRLRPPPSLEVEIGSDKDKCWGFLSFFGRFIGWWIFLTPLISAGKNHPADSAQGILILASLGCGIALGRRRVRIFVEKKLISGESPLSGYARGIVPFGLHAVLFTVLWAFVGDDGSDAAGRALGIGFLLFSIVALGTADIPLRLRKRQQEKPKHTIIPYHSITGTIPINYIIFWFLVAVMAIGIIGSLLPENVTQTSTSGGAATNSGGQTMINSGDNYSPANPAANDTPAGYKTTRVRILKSEMGQEPAVQRFLQEINADRLRLQKANQEIIEAYNALDFDAVAKNSEDSSRQINRLVLAANILTLARKDYEQSANKAVSSSAIEFNDKELERIRSGYELIQSLAEKGHAVAEAATTFAKLASDENATELNNESAEFVKLSEFIAARGASNLEKIDSLIEGERAN